MRQLFYVSDSLIGTDIAALDVLMLQARNNNALDGITGLLWTDGRRFAQAIEGGDDAVAALLTRLRVDPRHANLRIVLDETVSERQFGDWSMTRPGTDDLALLYNQRMRLKLSRIEGELSKAFDNVITGSKPIADG